MSTHPNALLILVISPLDLPRKTLLAIQDDEDGDIAIGEANYHVKLMESAYDKNSQISGKAGEIVLWHLATYGYGEQISWEALEAKKKELEQWAQEKSAEHKFAWRIVVSANYW